MAGINFDFTTGTLPAGITFTRASIGTYTNATGTLITAGNDVARFNYVAGVSNLLIEPSATNLCPQSNNFLAASWTQAGSCITTAAQFISPDGTNDGWTTTSGTGFGGPSQSFTFTAAAYTLSVWAKQAASVSADLVINAIDGVRALTPTLTRISATTTASAGTTYFATAVATNTPSVVMSIYGAQLELGSIPTSYIPTTTVAVTRQADSATFTVPAGVNALKYTFDDNSTQVVNVTPGSYTIPTNLSRANIKSIVSTFGYDFTGGSLPAGITFTRGSIGTYTNAGGVLTTAGNDVARLNYVGGVSCLLIEGSATNLLLRSNAFSTAPWYASGAPTVLANQFISPDGTNNGFSISVPSANGGIAQDYAYSAIQYTISIWAKYLVNTAPTRLVIAGNIGGPFSTPSLTRLSYSGITPAGTFATLYQIFTSTNDTNGYYGAQLETGSKMTSYIPTTTAAVTRAADSAVFTIPAGVNALLYTFDDGSTQQVSVTPGSYTIPTTLNRPNIKSIQGLSGFDFTTGTLPPGITFTRASIGTYFDSGNILRTASNNVARMNYVGGVSCLLIEGSATNLLLQSNGFSTTWAPANGAVITAAQFVSPDGSNNGWSITSGTGSGQIYELGTVANIPYTVSIWAKGITGGGTLIQLYINGPFTNLPITTTLARVFTTLTPPAGSGVINTLIALPNTAGVTNGIYGVQLETGGVMTSYIPTTTASVTRAVDQATFTIPTGVTQLTYTFDDNSTQTVSATPGSYTIPTTLNRPNIKSIVWVTTVPTPSPARVGAFQSFGLAANIPLQLTAGGTYRLYILNTGPGNLFVSTGNTPGPNATVMMIPPLKAAPLTTTAGAIWLSSDQDSTVSIAAMPR